MKNKTNKNHFSPVFANQYWTNEVSGWHYKYYYYCPYRKCVVDSQKDKGKTAWGYEFHLYSQELEDRLDSELENDSALNKIESEVNKIPLGSPVVPELPIIKQSEFS